MVKVTLWGGVNEIGGNKFLLEDGEHRLMLDFGTSIGARNSYYEEFLQPRGNSILRDLLRLHLLPDVDGLYRHDMLAIARAETDRDLPESAAQYRAQNHGKNLVEGVLLTHAHVDHFQDLTFVDPEIPVFCTPTTKTMLEAIEEAGNAKIQSEIVTVRQRELTTNGPTSKFPDSPKIDSSTHVARAIRAIPELTQTKIGAFTVTPIPVDHSVPGGCAFLVRTPSGKRVFYTGDIRFHGRLMDRTAALLQASQDLEPDIMLCEGTRMSSESDDNEEDVERGVKQLVDDTPGLAMVEFGWKDTTRFDTLQRVASAAGRTLLVDPRLAYLLHRLDGHADVPSTRIEKYGNVNTYLRRTDSMMDSPADYGDIQLGYNANLTAKDLKAARAAGDHAFLASALRHYEHARRAKHVRAHPEKYMVHLSFWGSSELIDLEPPEGSRWIRCATEPYSDEMSLDLLKQSRWLDAFGVRHNVTPGHGADDLLTGTTHVSGHASRGALETLVKKAKPKTLIPIHTAERSLDLFERLGFATRVFRGVDARKASRGVCLVEA